MKKNNLILLFGSLSMAVAGVGVLGALLLNKGETKVNAAPSITKVYLDLTGFREWAKAGAIFKLHTWSTMTGDVYTDAIKVSDDYWYAEYDFTKASGYRFTRFSPEGTEWNRGSWTSTENDYYYKAEDWTTGTWSQPETNWSIKGGVSPWTVTTIDDPIDELTFSGSGLQYSVKSYQLNAGTEFKIVGGSAWYGYHSSMISSSAKEYLSGSSDSNIKVNKTGTFDIYCKPVTNEYWIQVDSLTEAKEFSTKFLDNISGICSDSSRDNKEALQAIWADQKTLFEGMTDGAKAKFNSDSDETVSLAREKYEHIIERYGLEEWGGATPVPHNARYNSIINREETGVCVTVILSLAAVTAAGAFFYIKKRKENN